ncbi:hypothetical protein SASPL_121965 [Salvia splendens]|uniref:Cytochrome b-c1 complex subunit 7 n=1 Tax=Salvia splendens TaxID=180675 RepID=A0A8X8XKP8_SALSN|nr:hypothetical protein SASPL_121965 [Salvia splendens]
MASALSKWLVDPKRNPLAALHMKTIKTRLSRYGLRYDDLHDPMYDLDIKEALNRLPKQVVDARNQRLKRAMDLSMKHEYLPEDLQMLVNLLDTDGYANSIYALSTGDAGSLLIDPSLVVTLQVQRERAEREALGALPLYQRTLP